jgi:glutathione reductase (NADPH)
MIAEEDRIGGTCVIRGCVPKKLYVYASRLGDDIADAASFGWQVGPARFDWPTLRDAVAAEVTRLSGLYRKGLNGAGVTIVEERAVVTAPGTVRLTRSGESIKARHILIATGGHPVLEPVIPGGHLGITSNEIFHMPALPARMVVVGGGYIALEFACVFARLGVEVTLVHRGDNVLRGFDEDIRTRLRDALALGGITLALGRTITRMDELAGGVRQVSLSDGSVTEAEVVLVATGRRANTGGLGLDSIGVALNADGSVRVDAASATNIPGVHAVGDVTNRVNLTPVAIREGHAFADSVFGNKPRTVNYDCIPTAVFSNPPIASVGMTEAEARAQHDDVKIYKSDFRAMKNVLADRNERALYKMVVAGANERVVGLHLIGPDSGEILQAAAIAVKAGLTKQDFDDTVALHPSMSEELVLMK